MMVYVIQYSAVDGNFLLIMFWLPGTPLGPHAQDGVAAALRKDVCAHLGHVHFCERGKWVTEPSWSGLQGRGGGRGQQALSATAAGGLWGLVSSLTLDLHK